jgi:hypothetical protein
MMLLDSAHASGKREAIHSPRKKPIAPRQLVRVMSIERRCYLMAECQG